MAKQISAQIVADSINPQGNRITTYLLTYPRMIHSELMTHRMFSRNSASSRAIPFKKMIKSAMEDPFIPIAWQTEHTGMQGTNYITDPKMIELRRTQWLHHGRDRAIDAALDLSKPLNSGDIVCDGVTKQLCNRLLEPFMWHTVLVTATEYDNFFELRCPKYGEGEFKSKKDVIRESKLAGMPSDYYSIFEVTDWLKHNSSQAEIHIQALAESMWDAYNESTPQLLNPGEWHIPFGDQMDERFISLKVPEMFPKGSHIEWSGGMVNEIKVKIATARCARLSYMTFEGEINYEKDIALHDQLLTSHHMSPFEHCARCMTELEYYSFIKGKYPTTDSTHGIVNYELYPVVHENPESVELMGFSGVYTNNPDIYGWADNFRGFRSYRNILTLEK